MSIGRIFFIIAAILVVWHFKGSLPAANASKGTYAESAANGKTPTSVQGTYLMQDDTGGPRLSLTFLDNRNVQMYGDGKVWGPMCTYIISGNRLILTHACGVWDMEIRGQSLYQKNQGWTFTSVGK